MSTPPIILIVDDDSSHRAMLRTVLQGWGYATDEADDGDTAVEKVKERAYDAVLSDVRMARMDGISAIREILHHNPSIPVLVMTAWQSVETAVAALRLGAYDYLEKPLYIRESPSGLLGRSPRMRELIEMVNTVAPTEATVLITGESGTGKERVARAIQEASARRGKAFVTVNCAALNESLLESELFGHEKGAFTGADKRREGRFSQADGGTLFLDEIGELPLLLQAKLLRALNVIGVEVPSLRERREDIPVLATAFLERFALANRKEIKGFTPQAMDALLKYSWPGNVRELENAVERAAILCLGEYISERELPMAVSSAPKNSDAPTLAELQGAAGEEPISMTLDEMERAAILRTLQDTGDNKSEAARRLGITRATLHNKLRRYDME